jgi:hypothetical protein
MNNVLFKLSHIAYFFIAFAILYFIIIDEKD